MISDTSDTSSNCLSITQIWSPTTGGTSIINDSSFVFQFTSTNSLTMSLVKTLKLTINNINTSKALSLSNYESMQRWCMGAAGISISPPTDLGKTLTTLYYSVGSGTINHAFQPFTTSGDASCDPYSLIYN
jgi:hypothetical protein